MLRPAHGLPVHTLRDGRVVETMVSRESAESLDRELAPWAKHCAGCPARAADQAFGCYGFMSYPITAVTERWLVAQAMSMGTSAAVATQVLGQLGVTGSICAGLCGKGATFFESRQAVLAGWELEDGATLQLSSDVLLDLALYKLPGNRARLLPIAAVLFGLVPAAEATPQALMAWMKAPRELAPLLVEPTRDPDSNSLADYLRHVIAAARAELEIVADT